MTSILGGAAPGGEGAKTWRKNDNRTGPAALQQYPEPQARSGVEATTPLSNRQAYMTGDRIMATTKAREDIKNDLKTLKEDVKVAAREESSRLKEKAAEAESVLREKTEEVRERARGYYDQARLRSREYYDDATERFDEAQRYVTERVQERPVQSTAIALGVGVVLGLLLAGRRR